MAGFILRSRGSHICTADGSSGVSVQSPARIVTLALSGGDRTDLASAVADAIALLPTADEPVAIRVYPGTYAIDPTILPSHVSLSGVDGRASVVLEATTPTSAAITLGDGATLKSLTIQNADGLAGKAVILDAAASVQINDVSIFNCETGILADGIDKTLAAHGIKIWRRPGEVLSTGIEISGGASGDVGDVSIAGEAGNLVTKGLVVTGAGRTLAHGIQAEYCTGGVESNSGGFLELAGSYIRRCGIGVAVGATSEAHLIGCDISESTVSEIDVASTATFRFASGIVRNEGIVHAAGADFAMAHLSDIAGDQAFSIQAECHVGTDEHPKESAFGGGDSHARGMVVLTNTNLELGTWANITNLVNEDNGSSTPMFPTLAAGACVYVGGERDFPGLKMDVTVALAVGAGAVVAEYWNGGAWIAFRSMSTDSVFPYQQYADRHMLRVQAEQLRFDWSTIRVDWTTKTLDSHVKKWARYRITSPIATVPEVNIIKLHTHRLEVNADGYPERYGFGQEVKTLPLGEYSVSSGEAPGTATVSYAVGIVALVQDNIFSNNSIKGRIYNIIIPEGLDTSRVLTVRVPWKPDSVAIGDVEIEVQYSVLNAGDLLDGTAPSSNSPVVVALNNQLNETIITDLEIAIPEALPGAILSVKIFRDATGANVDDTFAANIHLADDPVVLGTYWR